MNGIDTVRVIVILVGSGVMIATLGVPAVQSFLSHLEARNRVLSVPDNVIKAGEESVFRNVCPAYAEASTWERWTNGHYRKIGWCEDYLHRLP